MKEAISEELTAGATGLTFQIRDLLGSLSSGDA
jgi:hypothetical protein